LRVSDWVSFGKKDQHYKHSLAGTAKVVRLIAVFVQEGSTSTLFDSP
ncbi:9220_t:CDS:1, partial [Paraglomus occultum]